MTSATLRTYRQSPRKVRLIAKLIDKKGVNEALEILNYSTKDAAKIFAKLLRSAMANAVHNSKQDLADLVIKSATVNEGSTLRRIMPRARGSAFPIKKRTSHITLILEEIKGGKKLSKRQTKIAKRAANIS